MEEYDLLQCIDKGLEPFGSNVKQSIFWKMCILHNYSRVEVLDNPELLVNVIRETLGDSSAAVEESVANEITRKFDLSLKDQVTMVQAISEAKRQLVGIFPPTVSVRTA